MTCNVPTAAMANSNGFGVSTHYQPSRVVAGATTARADSDTRNIRGVLLPPMSRGANCRDPWVNRVAIVAM